MLYTKLLCSSNQCELKCCLTIAQQLHQSLMTARELSIVVVEQAEKKNKRLQHLIHGWQNELATHWRSGWIQELWSLVSCVWSLQGLFPQEPLQRTPSHRFKHILTLLGRKHGYSLYCRLTHWLSSSVRVGPGAGALVAFGVCCGWNRKGVWVSLFFPLNVTITVLYSIFHPSHRKQQHCSDLYKCRRMKLFSNLYK